MTIPREVLTRKCSECGETKSLFDFWKKTEKEINGAVDIEKHYHLRCRDCYNKYHVRWRAEKGKVYRDKMRDRYRTKVATLSEDELAIYRKKECDKTAKRMNRVRDAVYMAYGGYRCACCGETEKAFLTLDHINDDGHHMRKNVHGSSGTALLNWAYKNNFPPILQILCWNCQWGKRKHGICPHQETRNDYPERE